MGNSPRECILILRVRHIENHRLFFEGAPLPVHFIMSPFWGPFWAFLGTYIRAQVLTPSGKVERVFLHREEFRRSLNTPRKNNYLAFQVKRIPSFRYIVIDKDMFNPKTYISYEKALVEGKEGLAYFSQLPLETLERLNFFLTHQIGGEELTPIDIELLRLLALHEISIKDLSEKELTSFPLPAFQEVLKAIRTKSSLGDFLNKNQLGLDIPQHLHKNEIHALLQKELKEHVLKEKLLIEEEKQHFATLSEQKGISLIYPQFSSKEYALLDQRWKEFFAQLPLPSAESLHTALTSKPGMALTSLSSKEKETIFLLTAHSPEICQLTQGELSSLPVHIKKLFEGCHILRKLYHPETEGEREEGLLFFKYLGPFSHRIQDTIFEKINLKSEAVYKDLVSTVAHALHQGQIHLFIDGKIVQRLLPLYFYEDRGVLQILSYLQEEPLSMSQEQALRQLHCMHQEIFQHQSYCIENRFIPHTRQEITWLDRPNCMQTAPRVLRFYFKAPAGATDFIPYFTVESYYITPYGKDHFFYIKATSLIYAQNGKGCMNLEVGRGLPHAVVEPSNLHFFDLTDTPIAPVSRPPDLRG